MKYFILLLAVLFFATLATGVSEPVSEQYPSPVKGPTVVIPIDGTISKAQFIFLRRALKEAEKSRAGTIVLQMDTYGGDLHAAVKMVDALSKITIPTLTFVDKNAGSAGALIALSTKQIFMNPISAIGSAAPVTGSGEDLNETMNAKVVSYFSKYFRSAAEGQGHNPDIAEAFINKDKEVKIGNKIISEKGELLSLSPQEATEVVNGKPVFAAGLADDLEALIQKAGLSDQVIRIEPTGFENLALFITTIAPLLLIAGLAGIYIEFKTPGFGLPGILGIVCLLIFFFGHQLAGLAGFEVFAIFVLGILLVLMELFFFPGVVLPALIGVVLMTGALFFAMVDRYASQPVLPSMEMLTQPLINMAIALIGTGIVMAILAKFLPKTPWYRHLVLSTEIPGGGNIREMAIAQSDLPASGDLGQTISILNPGGKARFGERIYDVMSEGVYVQSGETIRVLSANRSKIVVERVTE